MKRTITVLLAILVAGGMLASFAGPVAADGDGDGEVTVYDGWAFDTTVCTIETPDTATESAETSLCQSESPDDGPTIQSGGEYELT